LDNQTIYTTKQLIEILSSVLNQGHFDQQICINQFGIFLI